MAWLTTEDGRHFNTDWLDDEDKAKYKEAVEKYAQHKRIYDPLEKSVYNLWDDGRCAYVNDIQNAFRNGDITREQRDKAYNKAYANATEIIIRALDDMPPNVQKSLNSTIDRQFALTGGDSITGNLTLYKTANGFVIEMPATRSKFRMFMDNEGNVRRMPSNELNTQSTKLWFHGKYERMVDDKIREILYRPNEYNSHKQVSLIRHGNNN